MSLAPYYPTNVMARIATVVLIIDDEPQVRRFLRAILQGQNYHVLEAANGGDGMREAIGGRPDLIILDLGLPDIDGLVMTRRLREATAAPIIVLSAHSNEEDKVGALDAGADDYLTKPFGMGELFARMRVALRNFSAPNRGAGEPCSPAGAGVLNSIEKLSRREVEVLRLVAEGKTSKQIARELFVATKTVVWHRQSIMSKLELRTVADLTKYAVRSGLTSLY